MEMDSKALRYVAIRLAKAHSRGTKERAMVKPAKPSRRTHKPPTSLEVHVMFEPSHLAQQCLADAYAYLIPTVRRRLGPALASVEPAHKSAERNAQ